MALKTKVQCRGRRWQFQEVITVMELIAKHWSKYMVGHLYTSFCLNECEQFLTGRKTNKQLNKYNIFTFETHLDVYFRFKTQEKWALLCSEKVVQEVWKLTLKDTERFNKKQAYFTSMGIPIL